MSDALRRELAPLSVSVSIVEPGAIMTPIWPKIAAAARHVLDTVPDDVADSYRRRFAEFIAKNEQRARESKTRPEAVARAVGHAMTARRPRTRYHVGLDSWAAAAAARVLPNRALDAAIRRQLSS
jgi:short-subunit dehydrogenase